ncbi:MAG TPA: hypothetical protein VFH68_10860 [Polyangia bacterium]|jgi:hypothetical protein|nr:hypothetical protein [Polyangia bacterium]
MLAAVILRDLSRALRRVRHQSAELSADQAPDRGQLVCLTRMRRAALAMIVLVAPSFAGADDRVMLSPGPGYRVRWSPAGHRFDAFPRVERQGWSTVDRWFQVAPGGKAVAFWSASTGFVVMASNGAELWRRKGEVTAFRFSARGERLAIATANEIHVLQVARQESRRLAMMAGADWLGWTNVGWVVRTRSAVELVREDGKHRTLAKVGPGTTVAAGGNRLVLFTPSAMREINLAQSGSRATITKLDDRDPVLNADIDAGGARVLFATARRVYLQAGTEVKLIEEVAGVHSVSLSPDGSAQIWLAHASGTLARDGKRTPLPAGTRSAHFRRDGGTGVALTTEDGIFSWDPGDGAPKLVGGISRDDGVNITGDLLGGAAISFAFLKSGTQKEMQRPTTPDP